MSTTEGPRKTKIGTEVARITRDSDTTLKVKGQLAGGGAYCDGLLHSLLKYHFALLKVVWHWCYR